MMRKLMTCLLCLATTSLLQATIAAPTTGDSSPAMLKADDTLKAGSLANVYLYYGSSKPQRQVSVTLAFGDCVGGEDVSSSTVHIIGSTTVVFGSSSPIKFVWMVPPDATQGCIVATDGAGHIIAMSKRHTIEPRTTSEHQAYDGIYFDAVKFYESQTPKQLIASDKSETVGIVGAGMSGLFSALLLEQAGLHNYDIVEASQRLGGRVQTIYFEGNRRSLNGDQGSITYQERGAMRLPFNRIINSKITLDQDHRIVFLMADELNRLNHQDHRYKIDFIRWIQAGKNNLYYKNRVRLPDGEVPTLAQMDANSSLKANPTVPELDAEGHRAIEQVHSKSWNTLMDDSTYKAFQKAIQEGYTDFSEHDWLLSNLNLTLAVADYAISLEPVDGFWTSLYSVYTMQANDWRTVQGGMTRFAKAYGPILGSKVHFGVRVSKLNFEKHGKVAIQWKNNPYDARYNSMAFDNVIVSAPFSVVRTWHLPESLPYMLRRAITSLGYVPACKVAMEFRIRFWEHSERPIFGGCDTTDLFAGNICYPSNNLTSDGPGVMLASYVGGDQGVQDASMSEEQQVARVLEDIVELHGETARDQYTGNYDRTCWNLDSFAGAAVTTPKPGQAALFTPSYFEMNHGLVFVGEHTDIKHGWISAALDSAVRGVVMVLVKHGHIKEAKDLIYKWDIRWIKI